MVHVWIPKATPLTAGLVDKLAVVGRPVSRASVHVPLERSNVAGFVLMSRTILHTAVDVESLVLQGNVAQREFVRDVPKAPCFVEQTALIHKQAPHTVGLVELRVLWGRVVRVGSALVAQGWRFVRGSACSCLQVANTAALAGLSVVQRSVVMLVLARMFAHRDKRFVGSFVKTSTQM